MRRMEKEITRAKILNEATVTMGFMSWRRTRMRMMAVVAHNRTVRFEEGSKMVSGHGMLQAKSVTEIYSIIWISGWIKENCIRLLQFEHPRHKLNTIQEMWYIPKVLITKSSSLHTTSSYMINNHSKVVSNCSLWILWWLPVKKYTKFLHEYHNMPLLPQGDENTKC